MQSIDIPNKAINAAEAGVSDRLHIFGGELFNLSVAVRDKFKMAAVDFQKFFFKSRTVAEAGIVIKQAVLRRDEADIIKSRIAAQRLGKAEQLAHISARAKIRMRAGGI